MNRQTLSRSLGTCILVSVFALSLVGARPAEAATKSGAAYESRTRIELFVSDGFSDREGGSTGQGEADDAECQEWAEIADAHDSAGDIELIEGNLEGAEAAYAEAAAAENNALDRGCYILD